jgi:hypothetical protein
MASLTEPRDPVPPSDLGSAPGRVGGGVWLSFCLAVAFLASCSDGDAEGPADADASGADTADGGDAAGGDSWPISPLLTCAPGWWPTPDPEGVTVCQPWPADLVRGPEDDCAYFPGASTCQPLGSPCTGEEWATDLPDDHPVTFVRAGGGPGGSGTRAAPFGSLAEALAAAEPGAILALGRGAFDEVVAVTQAVTLWGACVRETSVGSSVAAFGEGTVTVGVTGAHVRNLRITGARPGVVVLEDGALSIRDVLFSAPVDTAVWVRGGELTLERAAIRDVAGPGPASARALRLEPGSRATLSQVALERTRGTALFAVGPETTVALDRVSVRETAPGGITQPALLAGNAALSLRSTAVECTAGTAVTVAGPLGTLTMTDTWIGAEASDGACQAMGQGLVVRVGAAAELERVVVDRAGPIAIHVGDDAPEEGPSTLLLRDGVIRRSRSAEGELAAGLLADGGAEVVLERVVFDLNTGASIVVFAKDDDEETRVTATDLSVRRTLDIGCVTEECAAALFGYGVVSLPSALVDLRRFSLAENALLGLQLAGGAADLYQGSISGHPVGVNVQTEAFALDRLQNEVRYVGNERNLDTDRLPVPDIGALFPGN